MPVSAVNTSAANSAITNAVQGAAGNSGLGQQAFLKLLTTQLSNQDPLSTQDNSQLLAQLAQFSTVEGVNNLLSSQTKVQATDLLGKTIQAQINNGTGTQMVSGQVTGVHYDASGVHINVKGSDQNITLDQISQIN